MICGKLEACVERAIKGHLPDECDNRKENCIEFSDTRMHAKCEEKKKKYKKISMLLTAVFYFAALLMILNRKPSGVIILLALNTVGILMMEVIINEKIHEFRIKAHC